MKKEVGKETGTPAGKEERAPVFQIVHGSFVDGWGTRTTVFLKGCPLRCAWCCNPEGQNVCLELKYTREDCIGCGMCEGVCQKGAVERVPGEIPVKIDRGLCNNCLECTKVCPTNALGVFGEDQTLDEVFRQVERDQLYFGSQGGVTIGGGEATVFPDFTLGLIRRCKAHYIHTALDTCGYIEAPKGIEALAEADLVLFDLKGMDSEKHRKNTGVSNRLIHENLRFRDSLNKDLIIRIPVIPGYTDGKEELEAEAEFLAGLKSVRRVDILPVHKYGELKYRQLGIPYAIREVRNYTREEEQMFCEIFAQKGLHVQIGG